MKILIENDLLMGGGVENVLQTLISELVAKGHDITVLASPEKNIEIKRACLQNVRCIRRWIWKKPVPRYSLTWLANRIVFHIFSIFTFVRLLSKRYDVAIAIKEGPCMKDILRFRAERYFAWVHVDYNYMHWTKGYFHSDQEELSCMRHYDRVVCVSHAAQKAVVDTIGDPGNLCVRYNPIHTSRIIEQSFLPCELTKPQDRPLLVSVGRLAPPKNYRLLLRACMRLSRRIPFSLWIVGDGPEREELEYYVQQEGLDFVRFLGQQSNPYPFMRQADIYVSSSTWESYGLAIQEALVLGLPVVSVACPAVEEVFDRRFGILTNNTEDALAMGLEQMLQSTELRKSFRDCILRDYNKDGLYEDRLRQICDLWE